MFRLQRQRESIDDAAENLQQLPDPVKVFRLVDEAQKNVVDLLPDERAQPQELAVNAMQHCLEKVALTRILRVEQLQQLQKRERERSEDSIVSFTHLTSQGLMDDGKLRSRTHLQHEFLVYHFLADGRLKVLRLQES